MINSDYITRIQKDITKKWGVRPTKHQVKTVVDYFTNNIRDEMVKYHNDIYLHGYLSIYIHEDMMWHNSIGTKEYFTKMPIRKRTDIKHAKKRKF